MKGQEKQADLSVILEVILRFKPEGQLESWWLGLKLNKNKS